MANSDMIVRVQADTKNYDANLAKASKTLKQFADNNLSMGGILKQSTGALTGMAASVLSVTAAIGAAKKVMGDMVRINMQFEQSSSNLAAVLGTSRDQITALTDQAKALGATTQYTASQILELQANLARLGFNQNEILNSTKSVQAMATAMGADLGEAANLAGSALRGFGLNATEMERVASVLSVGTTKSALSFEKLATALPIVQTAAAKTGFTIEDTVAMLGKLTDNGINAASAATQLRKILNDSTTAGTKLANALGGPVKSFDELVVALDKAGKAGQNHADSVALVNSKNATALDILRDMAQQREVDVNGVKKQTSALQELRDSITDCSDGMKSMQDEQLNTLQGSITILNSAWEGLMLTFSESNGVIKSVVDSLTELLGAWTKWRNRNAGGDSAIKSYEMSEEKVADYGRQYLEADRSAGMSDKAIKRNAETEKKALEAERDELRKTLDLWQKRHDLIKSGKSGLAQGEEFAILREKGLSNTTDVREKLTKQVAQKNSDIAIQDYIIGSVTPAEPGKKTSTEDGKDEGRTKSRLATLKAQYEEQEKLHIASLDRMHMKEEDYEASVYKIKRETLQKIADLYQDETAEKARANAAISQLDIAYQGTQMRLANKANKGTNKKDAVEVPLTFSEEGINNLGKQIKDKMSKLDFGSGDYLIAADNLVDFNTLQTLLNTAIKNGLNFDKEWFSSLFEDVKVGADVDKSTWQAVLDEINRLLQEKGLDPIKVNLDTGSLEESKQKVISAADEMKEALENMSSGVGAISTIGNAFNGLKGIGEDLEKAFSGDMDTWDSLMTVFKSGIGIMQTVIGVMEAINTLQELSSTLSKKKVADQAAETTAVVTGKGTEAAANLSEAGTAMTAAGANAAQSSSAAGKAVSGIPIVGPILAVAAIAAVLAATFAAMSKAKSAGKFATGGLIPGSSFSGDNLTANVNSGELILNRAQQDSIAGQLQSNPMGNMKLSTEISGTNLRIVMNNDNRARGGQRGFYSEIH